MIDRALLSAVLLGQLVLGGCARDASGDDASATVAEIRAATEKYRDVEVALADGYLRDPMDTCETPYHSGITGQHGVMGIHFVRPDLLGIDEEGTRLDVTGIHTDFLQPAILIYEPQPDGSLELVALENMVSAAAWEESGNSEPPAFEGVPYEFSPANPGMMTDALYDRHLWIHRDNPDGLTAQYNPNATCEHHVFHMPMIHPPGTTM